MAGGERVNDGTGVGETGGKNVSEGLTLEGQVVGVVEGTLVGNVVRVWGEHGSQTLNFEPRGATSELSHVKGSP
jgi:hypothetical protein